MSQGHEELDSAVHCDVLASVIAGSSTAIAIVSAASNISASRIVYANDACGRLTGCTTDALSGRTAVALAGKRPDLPRLDRAWSAKDGEPVSTTVTQPDGQQSDVEIQVRSLPSHGPTTYFAIVVRDVTARNRELVRTDAERLLHERMTSVTYLAAGAAYEIQNPLSRVLASLEIARAALRSSVSSEKEKGDGSLLEVNRAVSEALEGSERIREVIAGLNALARMDRGTTELFDVHAALELALELTAGELASRARLVRHYGELPRVNAHFGRLTQAFINLLTNAVEAIPHGSPATNLVTLETFMDSLGGVVVQISDTGQGIEPADLPHVFEPFFTSKPRPVSTGLGLSVARSAVLASHGEISIDSEVGRGATVRVVLRAVDSCAAKPHGRRVSVQPRQSILIIDRDPLVFRSLSRLFESERTIVSFATPEEGLERVILDEPFDLIVLAQSDDGPWGSSLREELERVAPHASSRILEIGLPVESSGCRPRAQSSIQPCVVRRAKVSA